MEQSRNSRWMLAAAVAASLMAVPAMAQLRAGQDGHANDSSNRIGSGGYNSGGYMYNNGINPNQVIYGNVTGGQWFHGPGERDPRQFTGPSGATLGDEFIRGTSGVPTAYQPATPQFGPQAFYGAGRQVAPPTGTERLGYTGSFVGTGAVPVGPLTLGNEITASNALLRQSPGQDTVLGLHHSLVDPQTGDITQLNVGQAILDVSSPLYGLQGLPGQPGSENATELPMFAPPSLTPGGTDRFRMQQSEIERLRSELQSTPMDQQALNAANGNNPNGGGPKQGNNAQQNGAMSSSNLTNAAEQPNSSNLNGQQGNTGLNAGNLTNANTPLGQQQRITQVQPRLPGSQGNALQQRLDRYLTPQMRELRANAQYVNQMARFHQKAMAPGAGRGATTQPAAGFGSEPAGDVGAGGYTSTPLPGGNAAAGQPVKIHSLAEGVSAKGLHDLLKSAEDLMKQDRFQSAIEKYDAAEQVAPHDMLIALGRANAELGAGFYHRASMDLHTVFETDPSLLMGQYDLKSWMSDQRLQFVTKELSGLATSDPKSEDPVFLLAYIAYNTGDTAKAADYLKQAKARSGGRDFLLDQLEAKWKLPGTSTPGSGLNK
jgi:tetratricopeptide (TPR) repeat protein